MLTALTAVSWRPYTAPGMEDFFRQYDAVIATTAKGQGSRGNSFEVYTYGQVIAVRPTLAQAKAEVEMVYGPLKWNRKIMPKALIDHPYWGPTTEFTDPNTIYYVESLPRL